MKIKQLREERSKLLNELETMVSNIEGETEVRELTAEEKEAFTSKKAQIDKIDNDIKVIEETRAMLRSKEELKEVKETRSKDEMEKRAVENFFRGHDLAVEERTMLASTSANQATMPLTISKTIMKKLEEFCPVLDKARKFNSKGTLRLLREDNYGEAGLTPEMQKFTEADVLFGTVELTAFKVSAMVNATFEMLENSSIDLSSYLLDVIVRRLSKEINKLCILGTGTNQAQGLINGTLTQAIKVEPTIDDFIMMQTAVNPQYLNGACWIVNRLTFQKMASLLDGTGRPYLTSNVIGEKIQYSLLGLPVIVDVNMDNLEAGKKPVMLVNISECYAINMLQNITVRHLTEVGFTEGYETFAGVCMFDGKIINNDALVIGVAGAATKASK